MTRSRIAVAGASLIGALVLAPAALAYEDAVAVETGVSASAKSGSSGAGAAVSASVTVVATTSKDRDDDLDDDLDDDSDEDLADDNGLDDSDDDSDERSEVAVQVQTLLRLAERDGGIGKEVREIAHEHASSSERSHEAKDEVEGRPAWLVFIIGTDYGNLGQLRSELATTENNISRLEKARLRATDAAVQAELAAQISLLVAQASTTEAFVIEHEGEFSLLGWFVRLFY